MSVALATPAAPRVWAELGSDESASLGVSPAGDALSEDSPRLVRRATDATELRHFMSTDADVFVPSLLAETARVLRPLFADFRGRLWLEDTYAARHFVREEIRHGGGAGSIGLVGTIAPRGAHWRGVAFAYRWARESPIDGVVSALNAGISDLWVTATSSAELRDGLIAVARAVEVAELTEHFAGVRPMDLSRLWEKRLCLMVRRSLRAGHRLTEEDLGSDVAVGGLSVELGPLVIGRCLLYDAAPGAALTFGMIEC